MNLHRPDIIGLGISLACHGGLVAGLSGIFYASKPVFKVTTGDHSPGQNITFEIIEPQRPALVSRKIKSKKTDVKVTSNVEAQTTQLAEPTASPKSVNFDLSSMKGSLSADQKHFFFSIRSELEKNKVYPNRARRLKQKGTVVVQFDIDSKGKISNSKIKSSCPFAILNESALNLVRHLSESVFPPPKGLTSESITIIAPINYRL